MRRNKYLVLFTGGIITLICVEFELINLFVSKPMSQSKLNEQLRNWNYDEEQNEQLHNLNYQEEQDVVKSKEIYTQNLFTKKIKKEELYESKREISTESKREINVGSKREINKRKALFPTLVNNKITVPKYLNNRDLKNSIPTTTTKQIRYKLLLIYTPLFGNVPWRDVPYGYNFTEVDNTPCPVNNCQVTYDKEDIYRSDAVYFHGRDLPDPKHLINLRKKLNKTQQIWIWLMHESPDNTFYNPSIYNGIFNWTSTYRLDSDVFIPYFGIKKLKSRVTKEINFAEGKDKKVLFITGHCDSYRMSFIRKLKKYIQVDVYGACGVYMNPHLGKCPRASKKCFELQSRYKFYLAIENSFCKDYITEKYFKQSIHHNIPLVMGGANYSNPKIALPNSFIKIEDFKSIEDLGKYLHYLDSNDTAFNEYHKWAYEYTIELQHGMCKVCKALWEKEESPSKVVNLGSFWNKDACLNKSRIYSKYL